MPRPTTGIVPDCPDSSEENIYFLELRCSRGAQCAPAGETCQFAGNWEKTENFAARRTLCAPTGWTVAPVCPPQAVGCGLPDAPAEETGRGFRPGRMRTGRKVSPDLPKRDRSRNILPPVRPGGRGLQSSHPGRRRRSGVHMLLGKAECCCASAFLRRAAVGSLV